MSTSQVDARGNAQALPDTDLTGKVRVLHIQPVESGGMGDVYHGGWIDQSRGPGKLAIKIFRGGHIGEKKLKIRQRLARETGVWRMLDHPNILPFLGTCLNVSPFPDHEAMVSPWMSNGNMTDYVQQNRYACKERLLAQVAAGLAYLHSQNVIHGDLKGKNVLISDGGKAVIGDFGRATIMDDEDYSTTLAATAAWTAPELLNADVGPVPISFKSDIWALGITNLELYLEGGKLWRGRKSTKIIIDVAKGVKPDQRDYPRVPVARWNALVDCWEFQPANRPTSAVMLDRLQAFVPK